MGNTTTAPLPLNPFNSLHVSIKSLVLQPGFAGSHDNDQLQIAVQTCASGKVVFVTPQKATVPVGGGGVASATVLDPNTQSYVVANFALEHSVGAEVLEFLVYNKKNNLIGKTTIQASTIQFDAYIPAEFSVLNPSNVVVAKFQCTLFRCGPQSQTYELIKFASAGTKQLVVNCRRDFGGAEMERHHFAVIEKTLALINSHRDKIEVLDIKTTVAYQGFIAVIIDFRFTSQFLVTAQASQQQMRLPPPTSSVLEVEVSPYTVHDRQPFFRVKPAEETISLVIQRVEFGDALLRLVNNSNVKFSIGISDSATKKNFTSFLFPFRATGNVVAFAATPITARVPQAVHGVTFNLVSDQTKTETQFANCTLIIQQKQTNTFSIEAQLLSVKAPVQPIGKIVFSFAYPEHVSETVAFEQMIAKEIQQAQVAPAGCWNVKCFDHSTPVSKIDAHAITKAKLDAIKFVERLSDKIVYVPLDTTTYIQNNGVLRSICKIWYQVRGDQQELSKSQMAPQMPQQPTTTSVHEIQNNFDKLTMSEQQPQDNSLMMSSVLSSSSMMGSVHTNTTPGQEANPFYE